MLIKKFKNFLNLDFRWKLIKLGKLINIELYPKSFNLNGWKSTYAKLIFFFLSYKKPKKFRKISFNIIFNNNFKNLRTNIILSLPRSASNLLRNLITSYVQLENKINNGVPIYNKEKDRWSNEASPIFSDNMYNVVNSGDQDYGIIEKLDRSILKDKIVYMSRHPIQSADVIDLSKIHPILLLRNPKEQIKSWIMIKSSRYRYSEIEFNREVNKLIQQNLSFLKYWREYLKLKNVKKYLIIDFNELTKNTNKTFIDVLKFFDFKLNEEIIKKCLIINSKENYKIYMGENKNSSVRFLSDNIIKEQEIKFNKINKLDQKIIENNNLYLSLLNMKT